MSFSCASPNLAATPFEAIRSILFITKNASSMTTMPNKSHRFPDPIPDLLAQRAHHWLLVDEMSLLSAS